MAPQRRQQWLRGILDLCVLGTLVESDAHGYAIARRLADAGVGEVKGGTLYPVLARLSTAGHVTTRWEEGEHGPGRKYYALTDSGRDALRDQGAAWTAFTDSVDLLIRPGGTP